MRAFLLIAALLAGVLFVCHLSPWTWFIEGSRPLPELVFGLEHSHYLELERGFWSALLAGLALALLGEALSRPGRTKEDLLSYEGAYEGP